RSEATRKKCKRVRFLYEVEFAIEKVIEINQFWIAFDDFVGLLLEWQTNVEPETVLAPGASLGRTHDPIAAAGDDHIIARHHRSSEFLRHFRLRRIRTHSRRTKHNHFSKLRVM